MERALSSSLSSSPSPPSPGACPLTWLAHPEPLRGDHGEDSLHTSPTVKGPTLPVLTPRSPPPLCPAGQQEALPTVVTPDGGCGVPHAALVTEAEKALSQGARHLGSLRTGCGVWPHHTSRAEERLFQSLEGLKPRPW